MRKILLLLPCVALLSACGTPAAVLMPTAVGAGIALNVHNSGDPVDSFGEAKDRVVASVKEGYGRDHFVGYELNE